MIRTIAAHELRLLSRSPFAWVAAALTQLIFSWLFLAALDRFDSVQAELAVNAPTTGLTAYLVVHFLAPASIVLMLATPLLCMGLFAGDNAYQRGLWASAPLSASEIVGGKFLGALTFQLLLLGVSALMVCCLVPMVSLDAGHLTAAFAGLAAFIAFATALSLLFSSLTQRPALAAFLSFSTLLLLWLAAASSVGSSTAALSPSTHLQHFMQGLIDTSDILYFVCTCVVLLTLTALRINTTSRSLVQQS
jgi:ABC-2 type transport system permease protein